MRKNTLIIDESFLDHIDAEWRNEIEVVCPECYHYFEEHISRYFYKTEAKKVTSLTYMFRCTVINCDCITFIPKRKKFNPDDYE
jgi:hypothetical protein